MHDPEAEIDMPLPARRGIQLSKPFFHHAQPAVHGLDSFGWIRLEGKVT